MKALLHRFQDRGTEASKIFPVGLEIYSSPATANVDILFIHGLTGGREKTWTDSTANQPWFETLLPSSCPTARILAFGYDANVTDYSSVVSENRIENHAKNLLTAVAQHRDSDGTNTRSLIFIAHSLGGLVCIDALLASKNSADAHLKSVLDATIAIAFLGTPHSGSALAKWGELLAKSVGVLKQTNSDIVNVLRTESEVLARIQSEFHTMIRDRMQRGARKIYITCFFEELPLPGIGTVVPKNSAILPQYISIGIHANHFRMTKFSDTRDPGYKSVVGEIQRWLRDDLIAQLPASKPATPVSNDLDWNLLRKSLSPTNVSIEHSNRRRAHLEGTAEWLFKIESYQNWRSNNAASSLWINGRPGCGKSILAFNITQDLRHVRNENSIPPIFTSYCTHDANAKIQSYSVLRTLAYQMALKYQNFAARLYNALLLHGILDNDRAIDSLVSCEEFWELFQRALDNSTAKSAPIFWIIDGLDEVEIEDRALLMDIAYEFLKTLSHCRVIVLSRDESDIRKKLLLFRPVEIRVTEDSNKEDIEMYINYRIRVWGALGSTNIKNDVVESLKAKSQSIFLWVKLVMDELERTHDIGKVQETLASLPGDMKELYNTIFRNLSSRLNTDELRIFRCIISWMTFAKKTLTLDQMAVALRPYGSFSAESLRISMPLICGSIILLENSERRGMAVTSVRLLHASLADYLKAGLDEGCNFSLNHGEAHGEISSTCLAQLRDISQSPLFYPIGKAVIYADLSFIKLGRIVGGWGDDEPLLIDPASTGDEYITDCLIGAFIKKQYPLLKYAKKEWAYHMEHSASNPVFGEVIAKKFVDLVLRGPAILIWMYLLRRKHSVREQCLSELLRFCNLMNDSEYLGIDIILDFALQLACGSSSGWAYSLGEMKNSRFKIDAINLDVVTSQEIRQPLSEKRRSLRRGILANTTGQYLLALQAYADSCGIHLSDRAALEHLDQCTPEMRRANLAAVASHICSGKDAWLLTTFGHALLALRNATWMWELISCLNEGNTASDPLVLELQAQLLFSMGDFVAATLLYSTLGASQPDRWDLKEILTSAFCLQGQIETALTTLPTFNKTCSSSEINCEKAWNEERRVELCIFSGSYQHGVMIGKDATEIHPEWWPLWDHLTECLLRLGNVVSAIDWLRAAQKQPRLALIASEKMTKILLGNGEYDIAFTESISTIRQFPRNYHAYKNLQHCWEASPDGVKPRILSSFRDLTTESDPYWVACVHYARILMSLKLFPQAIEACRNCKAIKENGILTYTAAQAYEASGRSQEALNLLLEAPLETYDSSNNFFSFVARLSSKLERWTDLQRALRHIKSMGEEWSMNDAEVLAWAHYKANNYLDCKEECEEALSKIAGSTSNKQLCLDDDLPLNGEQSQKSESFEKLHIILALAYVELGNVPLALQQLLLATASEPALWYLAATNLSKMRRLALASFCLDAGLQELRPSPAKSNKSEQRAHKYELNWTCEKCKATEFEGVGYTCVQCDSFDLCSQCFENPGGIHSERHSWLMFPSAYYPRLRIRGNYEEGAREIVDMMIVINDVEGKEVEVYM